MGNTDFIWQKDGYKNSFWMMASNNYYFSGAFPDTTSNWEIGGMGDYYTQNIFSATNSSSPAFHLLTWRYGNDLVDLAWKTPDSPTWTNLLDDSVLKRFTNNNVAVGKRYEYKLSKGGAGLTEQDEYLLTAINDPPIHERGKIILVVDTTYTNVIETDLMQLKTNLVGDGWTVIRTNVTVRHDDINFANNVSVIASIKSFIVNQYSADPANTKAVFIVGHVPIPYSGTDASDGHADHSGAWSAYDTNIYTTRTVQPPVDGKYALGLWPESANPFSLTQSGQIPMGAKSIHFQNFGSPFELRVNDSLIPLLYDYAGGVNLGDNIANVVGDISAFAGENVELKFTTSRTVASWNGLDSISFSPELIPEPSTWVLFTMAELLLFSDANFAARV